MTSHKEHIQTLIAEIDSVLQRTNPRLPWVMSGEVAQQRQILERVRNYLVSLQQTMPALEGTDPYQLGDSADLTPYQMMQTILRDVGYLRSNLGSTALPPPAPTPALNQPQLTAEVVQILLSRLQENLSQQIAQALESVRASGTYGSAPLLGSSGAITPSYDPSPALRSRSDQMLVNLDASLAVVFESLQRNIQSYHDSLTQGLERMYATGQQSEQTVKRLLEDLVQQVKQETLAQLRSPQAPAGSGDILPSPSLSAIAPPVPDLNPPPEPLDLSDLSLTPAVTADPSATGLPVGLPVMPNFPYAGSEVLSTEISGLDLTLPDESPDSAVLRDLAAASAATTGSLDGAIESWLQAVSALNQSQEPASPPPEALPDILPLDLSDLQLGDVGGLMPPAEAIAATAPSNPLDSLGDRLILELPLERVEDTPFDLSPVEMASTAIEEEDDTTNIDAALKLLEDLSVELDAVSTDLSMAEAEAQLEQMLGGTVAPEEQPGLSDDAQDELDEFYQSLFGSELDTPAATEAPAENLAASDSLAPADSLTPAEDLAVSDSLAPAENALPEFLELTESGGAESPLGDLDLFGTDSSVTTDLSGTDSLTVPSSLGNAPAPSPVEVVATQSEDDMLGDAAIVEDLLAVFTEPSDSPLVFGFESTAPEPPPEPPQTEPSQTDSSQTDSDLATLGVADFAADFPVAPEPELPDRPIADLTLEDMGLGGLNLDEPIASPAPFAADLDESLGAIAADLSGGISDAFDLTAADLFPTENLATGMEQSDFPPSQPLEPTVDVLEIAIDLSGLTDLTATDLFPSDAPSVPSPTVELSNLTAADLFAFEPEPVTSSPNLSLTSPASDLDLNLDLAIDIPTPAPVEEFSFADLADSLAGDVTQPAPVVSPVNPPARSLEPGGSGSLLDLFQDVPDTVSQPTPVEPPGLRERPPTPPGTPARSTDMLLVDHSFGSTQPDSEDQFTRATDDEVLLAEEVKQEGAIAFELDDFTLSSLSEDLANLETESRVGQPAFTLDDLASGIPTRSTSDNTVSGSITPLRAAPSPTPAPTPEPPSLELPNLELPNLELPNLELPNLELPTVSEPSPVIPADVPSAEAAPVFYQASPAIDNISVEGFADLFGEPTPGVPPVAQPDPNQPFTLADTQNLFEAGSETVESGTANLDAAAIAPSEIVTASLEVNFGAMNPIIAPEEESSPFTLDGMDDLFGSAPTIAPSAPVPSPPTAPPAPPPTVNVALETWDASATIPGMPHDSSGAVEASQDIPLTLDGMDDLFGAIASPTNMPPREIPPFKPELFKTDEVRLDEGTTESTPPFQLEKLDNLFADAPAIAEPAPPSPTDRQSLDAALQRILGNASSGMNGEAQNNSQKKKTP